MGNMPAAVGMLIAIVATLLYQKVMSYEIVLAGIALGGVAADRVGQEAGGKLGLKKSSATATCSWPQQDCLDRPDSC